MTSSQNAFQQFPAEHELHVVLGASSGIGAAVTRTLARQGKTVRAVSRHCEQHVDGNIAYFVADLMNAEETHMACQDAAIIYYCANAPYDQWAASLPTMLEHVITGAILANAKLVVADNLYMYPPTTQPMTEDVQIAPVTRKGTIRAQLANRLMTVHASGDLSVVIGRAPDYFGPAVLNSYFGEQTLKALFAGRALPWLMSLDMPHAFIYVDDFSRGLITLGNHPETFGQVWFIPSAEALTGRQLLTLLYEEYNALLQRSETQSSPKIQRITAWMIRLAGMFNPIIRETYEMRYEFDQPYLVDASRFVQAFGSQVTPHREALRETLRWYQATMKQR